MSTSGAHHGRSLAEVPVSDRESSYPWLAGVWVLVAAFAVLTVARSYQLGIGMRDPHGAVLRSRLLISLALFVVLAVVDAYLRTGLRGWSFGKVGAVLRARWTRHRLVLALGGLLAYRIVYFCYHQLKSWDVFNQAQDAMLEQWDRWIFLGHSPAVLLHDVLGQHVAAYLLTGVYESFSTLVAVSFVAAVVFPDRIRDGYVFITAGLWIWILGVGSYYLIPSLGPFHVAPADFSGLPHTMIQDTQARYMAQRAHLLAQPHASDGFAQVSAFASLHVGVTTVILLMVRYFRLRWATRAMCFFLAGTILATIYLGWHFAVDDVAGLVIAWLAVTLARVMIYPRGRPRSLVRRDLESAPWSVGV